MDSLLESTLTGKAMMDTRGSRRMDSYEQQRQAEDSVWSELAEKGEVDKIFKSADDEEGEPPILPPVGWEKKALAFSSPLVLRQKKWKTLLFSAGFRRV